MPPKPTEVKFLVPETATEWEKQVTKRFLQGTSIHDGRYMSSGSDINPSQFLLFRVLWDTREGYGAIGKDWPDPDCSRRAEKILNAGRHKKDSSWSEYLECIGRGWTRRTHENYAKLGGYAVVRQYQVSVLETPMHFDEPTKNKDVSDSAGSSMRDAAPGQSTLPHHVGQVLATPPSKPPLMGMLTEDTPSTVGSAGTSFTPGETAVPMTNKEANKTSVEKDEQIVNSALNLFLDTLTVHRTREVKAEWCMHRYQFEFKCGNAVKPISALVDGYFFRYFPPINPLKTVGDKTVEKSDLEKKKEEQLVTGKHIEAIIETKACVRFGIKLHDIRIQESTEMACWIQNFPPKDEVVQRHRQNNSKMKRFLIAQDRAEIYIIVGEFSAEYVDFVLGKRYLGASGPFLTMKEYGPFGIGFRESMKLLSKHMLAFAMMASQ